MPENLVYNLAVILKRKIIMKIKSILLSMVILTGSLLWGGASASSASNAEMRAYYVDPGSSKYQVGKIIAIDVDEMKVYKNTGFISSCFITEYSSKKRYHLLLFK
jgi:hypothetical protein